MLSTFGSVGLFMIFKVLKLKLYRVSAPGHNWSAFMNQAKTSTKI